jgi:hypothetical protein
VTVLASILAVGVSLLLGWFLIRRQRALLCFLTTLPFPSAAFAYTIVPHPVAMTALGVFWLFLFLCIVPLRRKGRYVEKDRFRSGQGRGRRQRPGSGQAGTRRVFYGEGRSAVRPYFLLLIPVLVLCLLLTLAAFPAGGLPRMPFADDLRDGVTSGRIGIAMFSTGGVAGSVNRVDLRHAGNIGYSGKTALRVRTDAEMPNYLKGFVGSVYTGEGWEPLAEADAQVLADIMGEHRPQSYLAQFIGRLLSFENSGAPDGEPDPRQVQNLTKTVEVVNEQTNPRNVYTPYGLISVEDPVSEIEYVSDGYLRAANRMFGIGAYAFRAYDMLPGELYYTIEGAGSDRFFQSDVIPGYMRDYAAFVQERYTQLPEGERDFLDAYRQEKGLDEIPSNRPVMLARQIVTELRKENTYSRSPGVTPEGSGFISYFLRGSHRGYCVHFATAATALLRSAGVPARYVEGYVVLPTDTRDAEGWVSLPDSRAHAWVEIFLEGFGWVPVEATPGRQSGVPQAGEVGILGALPLPPSWQEEGGEDAVGEGEGAGSDSAGSADGTTEGAVSDGALESDAAEGAVDGTEAEGGGILDSGVAEALGISVLRVPLWVWLLLLSALGLTCAARAGRHLHRSRRERRFSDSDRSAAGLAVYGYLTQLHLFAQGAGFPARNRAKAEAAAEAGDFLPETLMDFVLRARFGGRPLTEAELDDLQSFAKRFAEKTRREAAPLRRLFGTYVLGLF